MWYCIYHKKKFWSLYNWYSLKQILFKYILSNRFYVKKKKNYLTYDNLWRDCVKDLWDGVSHIAYASTTTCGTVRRIESKVGESFIF